jgi:O-antigen ligase
MFLTPLLIIETEKDIEKILFYFKIMVFLVTTLLIGQMIYLSLTGGFYTYLLRVTVLSANPIQVSRYLALGATMLMVMLIRRSPKEGLPYLILLLCILLGIVLTGSRGPLVSLFFGIIVYALLFERKNLSTLYFYGFIALITVVILMFILPESVTKRFFDMTEGAIILTQKGIARVSTIATRLSFWDLALTSWTAKLSTFLFGLGAGGFSHLFIWRDWHWYPHNVFIEIISELGIIGLSVFLFFLYSSYKSISKGIFNGSFSERSSIWVAGALVMFFAAQFSGDINDNRILWMMIGLSISSATIDYKNNVAKIENSF